MKYVFAGALVLAALLYVAAECTLTGPPDDGRAHLLWFTDPNPARNVQMRLFGEEFADAAASVDRGDPVRLIVRCATGTGPDTIDVYDQDQLQTYVQAGILLDLTPYAREMGFSPEKTYPAIRDVLSVEGRQYRFPCNVGPNCVVFNRRIFDDHGVAYPKKDWTWDEFIETGKRIRHSPSRSGETHLAVANYNNLWMLQDLLLSHGGRYFSEDGLASRLGSDEAVAAMQMYHDMMHVHRIIPTAAEAVTMAGQGGWGTGGINWFTHGKAAMILIGRWYTIQVPNQPDLAPHLGAVQLPHMPGRPSTGVTVCRGAGVNARSPHRKQALEFLQYLASSEYGRLIVQDGDALPPNPDLARTGEDLANKTIPDPAFHQPFIDAMKTTGSVDLSPFIDASQVQRWIIERIEKVENHVQEPREAMRGLADEIDHRIRLNLERRTDLRRKFEQVTGQAWTPDWWRTRQAAP